MIHIYSISSSKVYETKKDSSWQTPTNPYGTSFTSPNRLTSGLWYAGAIWFEGTSSPYSLQYDGTETQDEDGDGLYDSWEENGMDVDGDDTIDFYLPGLGADENRKDIFVEIDYMDCDISGEDCATGDHTNHRPSQTAIDNVKEAFDDAPVENPNNAPDGIELHVLIDEAIPHDNHVTIWTEFDNLKETYFMQSGDRASANSENIRTAKEDVYHYSLWAHNLTAPNEGSSGVAELSGNDFVVSLGGFAPNPGHGIGSQDEQEGTFMHELGHNLGLYHGGDDGADEFNCKPNYLSVMSYSFQFSNFVEDRPLDYSRSNLFALNENSLSEPNGIEESEPAGLTTVYGGPTLETVVTGNPVNWDGLGGATTSGVDRNINNLGIFGCNYSDMDTLNGFDDWQHLVYWGNDSDYQDGMHSTTQKEMTMKTVRDIRLLLIDALDRRINSLPSAVFANSTAADKIKDNIRDNLLTGPDSVATFIKNDDLKSAISALQEIRMKIKSVDRSNDISDSEAQKQIADEIGRIIRIYEKGLAE